MRRVETRTCGFIRVDKGRVALVIDSQALLPRYETRDRGQVLPRRAVFKQVDTEVRKLRMFMLCLACDGEARVLRRLARSESLS